MRPFDDSLSMADLHERIRSGERRATEIQEQLLALDRRMIDESDVAAALAKFAPVWEALAPREQVRLIDLLIERIDYDGGTGDVSITFHAGGIRQLADQLDTEDAA